MSQQYPEVSVDAGPVFIGGMGRSGTTLASVILDSHPDLHVAPELHFGIPRDLGATILDGIDLLEQEEGPSSATMLARRHPDLKPSFQFVTRCERAGLDAGELRGLIEESRRATRSELSRFEDRMCLILRIGRTLAHKAKKPRWGLKIMRQIRELDRFQSAVPGCRIIHVVRDGRDVASSQLLDHQSWGASDVKQAATEWVELILDARSRMKSTNDVMELRYEDLVLENLRACRELLSFVGLSWNDAVLRHEQQEHAITRSRVHHPSAAAVAKPVNATSISRYRRDLTESQIRAYESIAGDLLTAFGYPVTTQAAADD